MANQKNKETAAQPAEALKSAKQNRRQPAKNQAKGKPAAKKGKTAPKAKNEHPVHRHKVFAVFDFYTGKFSQGRRLAYRSN